MAYSENKRDWDHNHDNDSDHLDDYAYSTSSSSNGYREAPQPPEKLSFQGYTPPHVENPICFTRLNIDSAVNDARQKLRNFGFQDNAGQTEEAGEYFEEVEQFYEDNLTMDKLDDFEPYSSDMDKSPLDKRMMANAKSLLYFKCLNALQRRTVPLMVEKYNLMVKAPTGIGKTAAFLIPAIQNVIDWKKDGRAHHSTIPCPYVLIVNNTGALAKQSHHRASLLLGIGTTNPEAHPIREVFVDCYTAGQGMKQTCDIAIATMGRLQELNKENQISLNELRMLIIDEADRMTDTDFGFQVLKIFEDLPPDRQNELQICMFSATYEECGDTIQFNEAQQKLFENRHEVVFLNVPAMPGHITQRVVKVDNKSDGLENHPFILKMNVLRKLLDDDLERTGCSKDGPFEETIGIFCGTVKKVNMVTTMLRIAGYKFEPLSRMITKQQQSLNLHALKRRAIQGVVTTNIMARGVDIASIRHIIVLEMDKDFKLYQHRIGRTGRAGHGGLATVLIDNLELDRGIVPFVQFYEFLYENRQEIPHWLQQRYQTYSNQMDEFLRHNQN